MTTEEILLLHNVALKKIMDKDGKTSNLFYGGGEMESFFFHFRDPNDIESEIIPVLDHYINGNSFSIYNDLTVGGEDFVEVTINGVNFLNRNTLQIDQNVPLDDFKAIAQAWADFNK